MKRFRQCKLPAYRRPKRRLSDTRRPSPSIHSWALHRQSEQDALQRAERHLGTVDEMRSPLLKYRWTSDFQSDWKREIGHWLHTAEEHGYLAEALERVIARRKGSRHKEVDPNDQPHLTLQQELAPSKVAHYLVRTGWGFVAWEPETGGDVDVDLRVRTPDRSVEVDLQVKAPDTPGRVVNHRLIDGERDERVVAALDKAAGQLPRDGRRPTFIVLTALRRLSLSSYPKCAVVHLLGATIQDHRTVSLYRSRAGAFFRPEWGHVSGVVMLDYLRSNHFRYACTVLLNPAAKASASATWFPHARVCVLEGDRFRWVRGAPSGYSTLPDGTWFGDSQ